MPWYEVNKNNPEPEPVPKTPLLPKRYRNGLVVIGGIIVATAITLDVVSTYVADQAVRSGISAPPRTRLPAPAPK